MHETPTIRYAETPQDYAAFGALCRDYVVWSRERYADMPWFVAEVFGHQALDDELGLLAARYGPPEGRTMLATLAGKAVAGGAYRRLSDGVCELKRLYVAPAARGHGLGRLLSDSLIDAAKRDGFTAMRLDTGDRLGEAIALYRSIGFAEIAPYHAYPDRLMPHLVFMERAL